MKSIKHYFIRPNGLNNVIKTHFILAITICLIISACSPNDLTIDAENTTQAMMKKNLIPGSVSLITSLPSGAMGSAIGPGGDLYVTQSGTSGSIMRIDKITGEISTYTSGLPKSPAPIGGVTDVVFIGDTAYALVTLVGSFFGTNDVNGIYRIDGPNSYTIIADIGVIANANPPSTDYFLPDGLQYAIDVYQGDFLVTDGHHNRVYRVTRDGEVSEFKVFDNIVPTGLAVKGNTVFMSETGPVPHFPEDGKIVSYNSNSEEVLQIASGAPMLVDVAFNRGQTLFALSQGSWIGVTDGDAAEPNTGALVKVENDGSLTTIAEGIDRPTSLEFIKNTAYVTTLTGKVWTIDNVASPSYGMKIK